jgi:hypothetical protein
MSLRMLDQFPRGIVCRHAVRLAADADAVWSVVGNVGDVRVAEEFIERIDVLGSGVGAVRTLHVKGGLRITERIEEYSNEDRYYVYRVLDPGALDFTHYFAVASVQPAGPGQSILMWITTATAVDGKEAEMHALLDANILMVFAGVKKALRLQ